MPSSPAKGAFWRGARDALPFMLVVGPFALVFGVVATEAGLGLFETMAFSVLVIAGAAQFAAIHQMTENAPTIIVILTALAVNLRMAMYSAALVPHLGAAPLWQRACVAYLNFDQSYAMSVAEYERRPAMPLGERLAYFFGVCAPVAPSWYVMTLAGALLGETIPPSFALDFAMPITFIAIMTPMLRTLAHVSAAATSVVAALDAGLHPLQRGPPDRRGAGHGRGRADGTLARKAGCGMSGAQVWIVILALAVGTFLIRFSFLGLLGRRALPEWALRHLRYAPVAVIPGLVAPLVLWPPATGGETDLPRLFAALATLGVGLWLKNVLAAILAGALVLYSLLSISGM
jgi:predicted branched-subunit amino acid permease/branched-subunit amino acid transport protein